MESVACVKQATPQDLDLPSLLNQVFTLEIIDLVMAHSP